MRAPRWEYRTLTLPIKGFFKPAVESATVDPTLDALGNEGWELVSALDLNIGHGRSTSIVAIFKRPRD